MSSSRAAARPRSRWRNRALNLGLLLGSTLVALGIGEAVVRLFDIGPTFQVVYSEIYRLSSNPAQGYELRPGARDGAHTISAAGFRDREFERRKPDGVFRILAVGDSVTYGPPEERAASWSKQLERLLNEQASPEAPRFEVLNLGVTGYNIDQVVERLVEQGLSYEPDLIVYGYVLNDPQEISVEGEALKDLRDAEERRFRDDMTRGLSRVLSHSRLFLLARHAVYTPDGPTQVRFRHRMDPGYAAFRGGDARGRYFRELHVAPGSRQRLEQALDRLAGIAATTPVLVAIFPLFVEPGEIGYPLFDVHAQVAALCRARGLPVEDLAPVYDAAARRFNRSRSVADFMHPSAFGNRVAAVALYRALARLDAAPGAREGEHFLAESSDEDGEIARALVSP